MPSSPVSVDAWAVVADASIQIALISESKAWGETWLRHRPWLTGYRVIPVTITPKPEERT